MNERERAFVVTGERLPILTAARIVQALDGHTEAGPDGSPVVVVAPALDERERAILRAAGVRCVAHEDELGVDVRARPRPDATRREELVFATPSTWASAQTQAFFARCGADVAAFSGDGGPLGAEIDPEPEPGPFPAHRARFAFPDAVVDAYHLALPQAHPVLAALVGERDDVTALLGAPVANLTILTAVDLPRAAEPGSSAGGGGVDSLDAATAFAAALGNRLMDETVAVATDARGAAHAKWEYKRATATRRAASAMWTRHVDGSALGLER